MVPKIIDPHEIAEITVKFGTPINAAVYPEVTRPIQLDAFKITSCGTYQQGNRLSNIRSYRVKRKGDADTVLDRVKLKKE